MSNTNNWHLFCRVVDNFGDIGVCWRLAKQLVQQHQKQVTLWVDDLQSFNSICPDVNTQQDAQIVQGVAVRHWQNPFTGAELLAQAEVVIEAFACDLPEVVLNRLQAQAKQPVWLNLEYLSAEDWVEGMHGLPSPVHGMTKYFYFPGFTCNTGGLLWQTELLELPSIMQSEQQQQQLLSELDVTADLAAKDCLISLFAYENTEVQSLLTALSQAQQNITLLVPQGRVSDDVSTWFGKKIIMGKESAKGSLTIIGLPFMSQPQYDRVLAACDINFVRGEESFVRAQMLGLPMIWHIYEQEDEAHLVKLNAFLNRYLEDAPTNLKEELQQAFLGWNIPNTYSVDWLHLLNCLPQWRLHAKKWQQQQKRHGDLTTNLVKYVENTL